jgi:hypothetical protein
VKRGETVEEGQQDEQLSWEGFSPKLICEAVLAKGPPRRSGEEDDADRRWCSSEGE